ncbi:Histone-lysine N-methyltransferase SUV39H1 [Orchesella cincta]|uniref:Histone-lysine N-methyltransferase SUV39H1 n=1 Tax=Orchesella cincta TaxID=48709 RepID=A0A1D2MYU5_ORCCI|nr:Histone-lysine N-methyltransferase SUV39H1 [Orchesella cincta]
MVKSKYIIREVGGPKEGPKCDRHLKEVHYVAPCGVKLAEPHDVREYLRITDFNLTMDFFYLKSDVNVLAEFMPTRDLSNGKELRPVQVVNCLDHEPLPHFEYISEMNIATISESQKCCDCTDNCMTPSQCACVKMTQERLALRNVTVFTYNNRRLDDYIRGGIVECNKGCPCKKDCPTRVVQAGSMWPLQIFNTGVKGWGVRALHDMPAGSFLGTYAGELINSKEAELRTDQDGSTYMANLDYVPIQPGDKRKIYSSPKAYSDNGIFSSFQHSCNPNVVMQNVFIDTHDIRFPQLAFFTIKVVKAGSELVFDYNYDIKKNKGDPLYCSCLTPYCKEAILAASFPPCV